MALSLDDLRAFAKLRDWFTVTRATVRVAAALGGYLLDLEGEPLEAVEAMKEDDELDEIVSISGVAHPPDRTWRFAFRVDDSGAKVAANATDEALDQIRPRLLEVTQRE